MSCGLTIDSVRDRAASGSLSTIYLTFDGTREPEVPWDFAQLKRLPSLICGHIDDACV